MTFFPTIAPFEDTDYTVELCNNGACTFVVVTIEVCEEANTTAVVSTGLSQTETLLAENNLEEALQVMVALSDAELGCDDVEVFFSSSVPLLNLFSSFLSELVYFD